MKRKRPQKHNNKSCLLKKKQKREASREKMQNHSRVFFFSFKIPLQRKAHNGGGKLRNKREISLQTNKQTTTQAKRGRTKERREQNARKSWPPLSPPLRFWCFPFRRRQSRSVEEGGGGAKEAPIIIR